jgi:hypothetical protein
MATTSTHDQHDFHVRNEGSIILFYPQTDLAREWWAEHVNPSELDGLVGGHVIEHRFARDIIEDLVNHGFQLKAVR